MRSTRNYSRKRRGLRKSMRGGRKSLRRNSRKSIRRNSRKSMRGGRKSLRRKGRKSLRGGEGKTYTNCSEVKNENECNNCHPNGGGGKVCIWDGKCKSVSEHNKGSFTCSAPTVPSADY